MVPMNHPGSTVNLRLTIDQNGKPSNVRVDRVSDQTAYKQIIATVSKWEFTPARKNGQPVTTHVTLPLEVKGL
jgi:protein TonB